MPKHVIPRAEERATAFFRSILPKDPAVQVRPMFGNVAAFANGYMFAGVLGAEVFVRLGGTEREALLKEPGATILEPRKRQRMKEYVTLPRAWAAEPERVRPWIRASLALVTKLPAKPSKRTTP